MLKKRTTYIWISLLFSGTFGALADGKTLIVGQPGTPCPDPGYTTIGSAVSAAAPGDVVAICPALYTEQLVITQPLTLVGIEVKGIKRVLVQPVLSDLQNLATEAVITVMNTSGVTIQDLAINASQNNVSSCSPGVAGIHFFNASGIVQNSAIFGASLANPLSCTTLPFGNGFGVAVDASQTGSFHVIVRHNSIHDFGANGVQVTGAGVSAEISQNTISGVGPATGVFQFGVFILNGAVAQILNNTITEGLCGSLAISDCINQRSEGVTLRAVGDGTIVDGNIISNAQSGIFINGANLLRVTNNLIRNIDAMSGMDIQGTSLGSGIFTNNVIDGNRIFNVGPIDQNASLNEEGCGINEYSGSGTFSGNQISHNIVNDAYCGVAHVSTDIVQSGVYLNTLYTEFNSDLYTSAYPPAVEP